MDPGLLRERVTFQTRTLAVSGFGATSNTYADTFTRWARVKQEKASEPIAADRPQAQTRVTLIVRYDELIKAGMRAKWRNRFFEIDGPPLNLDGKRQWMDLMLIERATT